MKKALILFVAGALIVTAGVAAYAHYEDYYHRYGPRGGGMMHGPRGGEYGHGEWMGRGGRGGGMRGRGWGRGRGRGRGGCWNGPGNETCPCGGGYGRWKEPGQQQKRTFPEMVGEDKVREAAQQYLNRYLSGYSIEKIEKDEWRPLYVVTLKAENGAVQTMIVHGFGGQIMHVYPEEVVEEKPVQ